MATRAWGMVLGPSGYVRPSAAGGVSGGTRAPDPETILDIQNSSQQLQNLIDDIRTGQARSLEDYNLTRDDLALVRDRGLEDLTRARQYEQQTYGLQQKRLDVQEKRGVEDYGIALKGLKRNYYNLGTSQNAAINAAGVRRGGAEAVSQKRREMGQHRENKALDLALERMKEDIGLARQGLDLSHNYAQSGYGIAGQRAGENYDIGLGRAGVARARQESDFTTALGRAIGQYRNYSTYYGRFGIQYPGLRWS